MGSDDGDEHDKASAKSSEDSDAGQPSGGDFAAWNARLQAGGYTGSAPLAPAKLQELLQKAQKGLHPRVWVKDPDSGMFSYGELLSATTVGQKPMYAVLHGARRVNREAHALFGVNLEPLDEDAPAHREPRALTPHDLSELEFTHQAAVVQTLKARFQRSEMYTRIGGLLLALNPGRTTGQCSDTALRELRGKGRALLEGDPHIFQVAAQALYECDRRELGAGSPERNQSIVILGEPGSGKTESFLHCLRFLTSHAQPGVIWEDTRVLSDPLDPLYATMQDREKLYAAIHAGHTILSAIGHAHTHVHASSSRVGKHVRCFVRTPKDGRWTPLAGAEYSFHLLETSRVTGPAKDERNFNIFYELLRGAGHGAEGPRRLRELGLSKPDAELKYLMSDLRHVGQEQDYQNWVRLCGGKLNGAEVRGAFDDIGLKAEEVECLKRAWAAILLMGEVVFKERFDGGEVETEEPEVFTRLMKLLGVPDLRIPKVFEALAKRKRRDPREDTEVVENVSAVEARRLLDSVARNLYDGVAEWLCGRINRACRRDQCVSDDRAYITLLDLCGYEQGGRRDLYSLLRNYTADRLVDLVQSDVFVKQRKLYQEEKLELKVPPYRDNKDVLEDLEDEGGLFRHLVEVSSGVKQACVCGAKDWDDGASERERKKSGGPPKMCDFCGPRCVEYRAERCKTCSKDRCVACLYVPEDELDQRFEEYLLHQVCPPAEADQPRKRRSTIAVAKAKDKAKESFSIRHSCGEITYLVAGFRAANVDAMPRDVREAVVTNCSADPIKAFFRAGIRDAGGRRGRGVGFDMPEVEKKERSPGKVEAWQTKLNSVLGDVYTKTTPHFLLCLRPFAPGQPRFDENTMGSLVSWYGLIEAIELVQNGYTAQVPFDDFITNNRLLLKRFKDLRLPQSDIQLKGTCMEFVQKLVQNGDLQAAACAFGETKVFLRRHAAHKLYRLADKADGQATDAVDRTGGKLDGDQTRRAYSQELLKLVDIQAYARQFQCRYLAYRGVRLRRVFWGFVAWKRTAQYFIRFNVALKLFQLHMRNLRALHKCVTDGQHRVLQEAKEQFLVYHQVAHARRVVADRVSRIWDQFDEEQKRDSIVQWTDAMRCSLWYRWRHAYMPFKRLAKVRMLMIAKIQALIRGMLLRQTPIKRDVDEAIAQVRERRRTHLATLELQRQLKGHIYSRQFEELLVGTQCFQYHLLMRKARSHYKASKQAAVHIQRMYRGWLARSCLAWEKLQVMYRAEQRACRRQATSERLAAAELGPDEEGVVVADVELGLDAVGAYPEGWVGLYAELRQRGRVQQLAMGAEHTVALSPGGEVFCWGSDEVCQLGIGAASQGVRIVKPLLRHKVLEICCGRWHTLAHVEGTREPVHAWGLNHRGQCGVKQYAGDPESQSSAMTPTYPSVVRTPAPVSVLGKLRSLAAGAFHSAAIVGDRQTTVYAWGEARALGCELDVRAPVRIALEQCDKVVLGDSFGLLYGQNGMSCFGLCGPQLGIQYLTGCERREPPDEDVPGFWVVAQRLRTDTHEVACRTKSLATPIPVRLPQVRILAVALGQEHVAALTEHREVFEWGVRHVVRVASPDLQQEDTDLGLVVQSTPVRIELQDVLDVQCGGDTTMVLRELRPTGISVADLHPTVHCAWSFVEQQAEYPEVALPALKSYRALRSCKRLEVAASTSVSVVLGLNPKLLEQIQHNPHRVAGAFPLPSGKRGGAQPRQPEPLSPGRSPRRPQPVVGGSPGPTRNPMLQNASPTPRLPHAVSGVAPRFMTPKSPRKPDPRPRSASPSRGLVDPTYRGPLSPPAPSQLAATLLPGDPPRQEWQETESPRRFRRGALGGRTPAFFSPTSAKDAPPPAPAAPSDLLQSAFYADVTSPRGPGGPTPKARYLCEIQHLLHDRSAEELEEIATHLAGELDKRSPSRSPDRPYGGSPGR